jgi:hypothetical protein
MEIEKLKSYNSVIQICPECSKIDVYFNDGHDCEAEIVKKINREMSDN